VWSRIVELLRRLLVSREPSLPDAVTQQTAPLRYLSSADLDLVRGYLPDYAWAARVVGNVFPPLALGPIHYRESTFRRRGEQAGEGPFGLDLGGATAAETLSLIERHVRLIGLRYGVSVGVDLDKDFRAACLVAAHTLATKIKDPVRRSNGTLDLDALAMAWWGYNGRLRRHSQLEQTGSGSPEPHWRWSSYVSNDPKAGVTMRIIGTLPPPVGSPPGTPRRKIDRPDPRPGCLAVWRDMQGIEA
jgi:hypothetical protein